MPADRTGPVVVVGAVNVDTVWSVDVLPRAGETVLAPSPVLLDGGKGANQAVAAARLGADVRLVACVGVDPAGDRALAGLRAGGVDDRWVSRRGPTTGAAVVLVSANGENTIVVAPGANGALTPGDVGAACEGLRAGVLLVSLEIPLVTAEAAVVAAAAAGLTVVVNPAPAQALGAVLLRSCAVLVPNEHEVDHLGQPDVAGLLAAGVGAVVVTRGARGASIHRVGRPVVAVPAATVAVVDTTGAGDAFCGALAAALAAGTDLESAVGRASAAGALATRAHGARGSLPSAAEVSELVRSGGGRT